MRIRSNKLQNKIITWPDSLADDYIHWPIDNKLDQICFYDMTRCYKKRFNAFWKVHVNDKEENTYIQGGGKSINSRKLILDSNSVIWYNWNFHLSRIALLKGKLCPLNELDLKYTNPPHHVIGKREMYAKFALLMFYPFRQLNDLKCDGSYWKNVP